MPRITLELLRKRVEHNEGEIHSVEELALHQEKIERLEYLDKWCKKLKILLLHNNLITKIENVSKLKELEYLNLALNNIERIENMEGCESLKKLDLTLNFIGEITSVHNLKGNISLENLYLTGNPCTDFPGYRKFIVNALPQLKSLDGTDITPTERLKARQDFKEIEQGIFQAEHDYKVKRSREKNEFQPTELPEDPKDDESQREPTWPADFAQQKKWKGYRSQFKPISVEKPVFWTFSDYWNKVTPNTPEVRAEISLRSLKLEEKSKNAKSSLNPLKKEPREISRFYSDGRPKNINQAKISFSLDDDDEHNALILELSIPKHLDTSLIEAQVEPTYATFVIKGKLFQMVLPEEVKPDSSVAQRSQTTGHLVVHMPKLNESTLVLRRETEVKKSSTTSSSSISSSSDVTACSQCPRSREEPVDWRNIVKNSDEEARHASSDSRTTHEPHVEEKFSQNNCYFDDNPEVPPLI